MRVILLEVVADALQIRGCGGRPADTHGLGAQHLLETGVHFFFFDELTPVGLGYTFFDGGAKASFLRKQAQSGVLHPMLGFGT